MAGSSLVHKRMAGARITVKLVRLAEPRHLGVDLGDIGRIGVRIVLAEDAEHRTPDAICPLEGRRPVAPGVHNVAAPENYRRTESRAAGRHQVSYAPAHAETS